MLVAAALVPDTALLVPGAAGAADVLAQERSAALAAVRALGEAAERVVVVSGGPPRPSDAAPGRGEGTWAGPRSPADAWLRPSLSAAGIADDLLRWEPALVGGPAGVAPGPDVPAEVVLDVGAAVALHLLARAGWTGPVQVVLPGHAAGRDTATATTAAALARLGRQLVVGPERVAMLLAGSLSARRGPDGPLPTAPEAADLDDGVLADLLDLGAAAARRLRARTVEEAVALAVSAWVPWQVLLGAVGDAPWQARLGSSSASFGVTYAVVLWTPAGDAR